MKIRKQRAVPVSIIILIALFMIIFIFSMMAPILFPIDLGATDITSRLKELFHN